MFQELRKVLGIGLVIIWLEDVEESTGLEAIAELFDCLCANTIDAQEIILGLADEITHGLDAHLAELVGQRCDTPRSSKR